jgi:hypothetical protein
MKSRRCRDRRPRVENAPVIYTWHTARFVRQEQLDGNPFIIGEFVADDSKAQFGSLNHRPAAKSNFAFTSALLIAMG